MERVHVFLAGAAEAEHTAADDRSVVSRRSELMQC
jgi:hypothetical protein